MKLRLILDVEYELNGEEPSYLKKNLNAIVLRAMGEGAITGSSEAEVVSYKYRVEMEA